MSNMSTKIVLTSPTHFSRCILVTYLRLQNFVSCHRNRSNVCLLGPPPPKNKQKSIPFTKSTNDLQWRLLQTRSHIKDEPRVSWMRGQDCGRPPKATEKDAQKLFDSSETAKGLLQLPRSVQTTNFSDLHKNQLRG